MKVSEVFRIQYFKKRNKSRGNRFCEAVNLYPNPKLTNLNLSQKKEQYDKKLFEAAFHLDQTDQRKTEKFYFFKRKTSE
ncbi:MAG: hypothetical protein Q8J88_03030 [Bacteroidales bacterium]|nr:hypothetical protein [Bacteroidales bacterium]